MLVPSYKNKYLHKYKLLVLSRLSDFMTCSEGFNIFSEGSLSQLGTLWKIKFGVYVNQTLIHTNCEQCYA